MKRNLLSIVILSVVLMITSCSKNNDTVTGDNQSDAVIQVENTQYGPERDGIHTGYDDVIINFAEDLSSYQEVASINRCNDGFVIVKNCVDKKLWKVTSKEAVIINSSGDVVNSFALDDLNANSYDIYNNELIYASQGKLVFVSLDDGSITKEFDIPKIVRYVYSYNESIVLLADGNIYLYDSNGAEISSIKDSSLYINPETTPVFESDGNIYVTMSDGYSYDYYWIDFNSSSLVRESSSKDIDKSYLYCSGEYYFDQDGEYVFDPLNKEIVLLADWNNINVKPASKIVMTEKYYPIDDWAFFKMYSYTDGSLELQMYNYNEQIDYSDMTTLTIGGYYTSWSMPINMAVYEYNKSQSEYRIRVVNYEIDNSNGAAGEYESTMNLIKEFASGNTPDIYYGNKFDYDYFYRNGLVLNILPYLNNSDNFEEANLEESVWALMSNGDTCYKVFPSFSFNGYWGKSSDFGVESNLKYDEFFSFNSDNVSVCGDIYSTDIADVIIRYSLENIIDNAVNSDYLSIEQLEGIIGCAIQNGLPCTAENVFLSSLENVSNGDCLASWQIIGDFQSYSYYANLIKENITYIGLPSVYNSAHMVVPDGMVAVSSDTEYPEACVDFITFLFSKELQQALVANQGISVCKDINEAVYENYLADESDDVTIPNNVDKEDVIDGFRNAIDSIDTLATYDWGVYVIICDEINSYDLEGKPIDQIAESLQSRLVTYIQETH